MSHQVLAKRHLGIGGHQSPRALSVEWLTPRYILRALGPFDLDPCAPVNRPWNMAARHYTLHEDGLAQPWEGRVFLNPPYGGDTWAWLERLSVHGNGIALVFARTETAGFHRCGWALAHAMHFFRGRLTFHRPDGSLPKANCGGPSVLVAYGSENAERLRTSGLPGKFVGLR
ncbi:MAG TPA: DNA N-6-adenine-methyltransferase [bacterium]